MAGLQRNVMVRTASTDRRCRELEILGVKHELNSRRGSMTVTISRLYDSHNDAQQVVQRLESAGVAHSNVSIVANNSDSWFNTDKKVDRDGVDDRAEGAGKGAAISAGVGGAAGLLPGLACRRSPASDPLSQRVGWPRPRLARPQEPPPAVSSVRSRRPAFRRRMLNLTQKASVAAVRWCRRVSRTPTSPALIQY